MRALRERAPFVVVPLVLVALASALVVAQGPYYSRHLDPDYIYLLNALNLLELEPPRHTDHPGTTLQMLGAVCVLALWLVDGGAGGAASLEETVLREPERYLHAIQFVVAVLVAVAVYAAGRAAARAAGARHVGIALQLGALLFVTPLQSLPRVYPEPLLFAGVFALMIPLLPLVFAAEAERSRGAFACGAIFGLGMVSKVTFLPLAAAVAFFPDRRSRVRFAVAALLTMAVATVPIWPRLRMVAEWLWLLLTRSGIYGRGTVGAPGAGQVRANLDRILSAEPLLAAWLIFYLAAWLALRFGLRDAPDASSRATARAIGFGVCVLACQVALAAKHYMGPRYLLPALLATALPNAALLRFVTLRKLRAGAGRCLAIGGGVLVAASLGATAVGLVETFESDRAHRAEALDLARARERLGDCVTIGYYRSSAGDYALHFANLSSDGHHAVALERLHPGSLSLHRWSGQFLGFRRERRNQRVKGMLQRGRCVLVQGSVLAEVELPPGFTLRELVRGRHETLSRLELAEQP